MKKNNTVERTKFLILFKDFLVGTRVKLTRFITIFLNYYSGKRLQILIIRIVSLLIFLQAVPHWFLKLGAISLVVGGLIIDFFLNPEVNFFGQSVIYRKIIRHLNNQQAHIITIHIKMNLRKLNIYLGIFSRVYNLSMIFAQIFIIIAPWFFYWLFCVEFYGFITCVISWILYYLRQSK